VSPLYDGGFSGHCDWRLPTIMELGTILDTTQGVCGGGSGACIDPIFGPTQMGEYWSATHYAGFSFSPWSMYFGDAERNVGRCRVAGVHGVSL